MDKKLLLGLLLGLIIATTAIYALETMDELVDEGDMIKGPFFLAITLLYIPVTIWALRTDSTIAYSILISGTVAIMILYAVTRTELAQSIGMEAGGIGNLGILSKVFQIGIVIVGGLLLVYLNNNKKMTIMAENRQR